jgi:hypothetical protein
MANETCRVGMAQLRVQAIVPGRSPQREQGNYAQSLLALRAPIREWSFLDLNSRTATNLLAVLR